MGTNLLTADNSLQMSNLSPSLGLGENRERPITVQPVKAAAAAAKEKYFGLSINVLFCYVFLC